MNLEQGEGPVPTPERPVKGPRCNAYFSGGEEQEKAESVDSFLEVVDPHFEEEAER